jgi:hypothetical protein
VIGVFGYLSAAGGGLRTFAMIFGAVISAIFLNMIAYNIFVSAEMKIVNEFGTIHEDQMLPDMPNLMTGMIMFGWAFFFPGYLVGMMSKRDEKENRSEKEAS